MDEFRGEYAPEGWEFVCVESTRSGIWYATVHLTKIELTAEECRILAKELMEAADEIDQETIDRDISTPMNEQEG